MVNFVHPLNKARKDFKRVLITNTNAEEKKDELRLSVIRILEENPDITQRELAKRLGISLGRINYCLKALVEVGYVKTARFRRSKNKFGYAYVLTPSGIRAKSQIMARFLSHKMREHEALIVEIETLTRELGKSKRRDR